MWDKNCQESEMILAEVARWLKMRYTQNIFVSRELSPGRIPRKLAFIWTMVVQTHHYGCKLPKEEIACFGQKLFQVKTTLGRNYIMWVGIFSIPFESHLDENSLENVISAEIYPSFDLSR